MADLTEDPLAPDWGEIEKGNTNAIADAMFLIWQRLSTIENKPYFQRGNWTPIDGSGAGLAFAVATGTWIKIGTLVILRFNVTYPATVSGAAAKIGGFPYYTSLDAGTFWGGFFAYAKYTIVNTISLNTNSNFTGLFKDQVAVTNVALTAANIEGVIIYEAQE